MIEFVNDLFFFLAGFGCGALGVYWFIVKYYKNKVMEFLGVGNGNERRS